MAVGEFPSLSIISIELIAIALLTTSKIVFTVRKLPTGDRLSSAWPVRNFIISEQSSVLPFFGHSFVCLSCKMHCISCELCRGTVLNSLDNFISIFSRKTNNESVVGIKNEYLNTQAQDC